MNGSFFIVFNKKMVTLRIRKEKTRSAAVTLRSPFLRTTSALYPGRGKANHLSSGG